MDAIKRSGAIKKTSLLRVLRSMTTLTTFPNPLPTFLLFLSSGFLSQFSFPFIEREKQILERSIVDVSCFPDWTNLFKLSKLRFNYSFLWILSLPPSLPLFSFIIYQFFINCLLENANVIYSKRNDRFTRIIYLYREKYFETIRKLMSKIFQQSYPSTFRRQISTVLTIIFRTINKLINWSINFVLLVEITLYS